MRQQSKTFIKSPWGEACATAELQGFLFMEEIWKPYLDYEISSIGNVRKNGKKIAVNHYKVGYCYFSIIKKKIKVHRAVAECFIPNPDNKKYVNHINGIKSDNRVENLEWVTSSENRIHAFKIGVAKIPMLKGEESANSKITEIEAKEIKYGHQNLSQSQIAKIYNIRQSLVSRIRNGVRWGHI